MRVFFLSDRPCVLSINGLFLGSVDGHERSVELDPEDAVFCELQCPAYRSVCFRFDEAFLLSPPAHVQLYYTRTGVAVYVSDFLRENSALRPVWQKKLLGTLCTLYVQGSVQLSLENELGFHIVNLPDAFEQCEVSVAGNHLLLETQNAFCLIDRSGTISVHSDGTVTARGHTMSAEVPFHDSLRHTALCTWEDGKLVDCRIRTAAQPSPATYALALFESVLIGADVAPYLAENLLSKADALPEFLGKFCSVVLTERVDEVGLVYTRSERVFDVRYYRVALSAEGKITNILPID